MSGRSKRDLLGSALGAALAWWLPIGAMVLAIPLPDGPKMGIWLLALAWMGSACLPLHTELVECACFHHFAVSGGDACPIPLQ